MTVREIYERNLREKAYAITYHLPALRDMATYCDKIVELGVSSAKSSSAFLDGLRECGTLVSYDIAITKHAAELRDVAGLKWRLFKERSELGQPIEHDLLFVDSLHTYRQVKAELELWAPHTTWRIVLHDTVTFGSYAAAGESGKHVPRDSKGILVKREDELGIRLAVDELMMRDDSWHIVSHDWRSHGLLVLGRR